MYLLLTDESNLEPGENVRFFVYGGLLFPIERLMDLDSGILAIREAAGFRPEDPFKFDTRQRPEHIDPPAAARAKRDVVDLCRRLGCKFIAYGALHAIIRGRPRNEQVLFGANSVIERFNRFLEHEGDHGIVLTDTLPVNAPNQYLREKFARGLEFDGEFRPLPCIRLFGSTCSGASHVASAIDIVLGCFRYAINAPRNREAAGEMIANVVDLMWGYRRNNEAYVLETGLILRPVLENIRIAAFRREYEELLRWLDELDRLGLELRRPV